jgi:hypothetical protein
MILSYHLRPFGVLLRFVPAGGAAARTTSTGHAASRTTFSATLPRNE